MEITKKEFLEKMKKMKVDISIGTMSYLKQLQDRDEIDFEKMSMGTTMRLSEYYKKQLEKSPPNIEVLLACMKYKEEI